MKHIMPFLLALSLSTPAGAGPGTFPADGPLPVDDQVAPVELTVVVVGPPGDLLYMNEKLIGFVPMVLHVPEGIHLFRAIDQNGQACSVEREIFKGTGQSQVIELPC
jgi:hypothetical protein